MASGWWVPDGAVGQRPDLTGDHRADPVLRVVVLMLLTVDGVLCALAAAFLLPSYLGPIWFPVSALVAGLVNVALVWAAMRWTSSARLAALPLISWALTIVIMAMGGPGADRILDGAGVAGFGSVLLMLLGAIPPILLLKRAST